MVSPQHLYLLLLLESLTHSLAVLQELLGTFHDTTAFFGGQVGRCEIVDTVVKALGNQIGVQTHELLHLLLSPDLLNLLWFFDI